MRGANQHLSGEEIEQLTSIAPDVAVGALEGAMRHLERCDQCRFRMLLSGQDLPRVPPKTDRGSQKTNSDCPSETKWLEVAAGLGTKAERKRHIEHAAMCARCGPLLRQAVEDVGMELTAEEETKVAALNSAQPGWQSNLAKKIADEVPPKAPVVEKSVRSSKKFVFWPRWAVAFAALIVASGGGWWAWILLRAPSVEELLAQAYTEQRTIEMRISGAKYAPMRVERGPSGSNLSKPTALLKAEALIGEGLKKAPNDPALLQAKARADLLDGNYGDAIKSLQRAVEAERESPSLLTDLGIAYFQRATADPQNHASDYGKAYETLSTVLAKLPDDPIALFNRAIVAERLTEFRQAEEDWEHYLRIESSGPWSEDAKERLRQLREKYHSWKHRRSQPLLSPSQLADQYNNPTALDIVDQRIEEYLHIAVRDWLSRAFPADSQESPDPHARVALVVLSQDTRLKHRDLWLKELLGNSGGRGYAQAVNALSAALSANDRGDYDEAKRQSIVAEHLFAESRNFAGVMRSQFERLFALQFIRNEPCVRVAKQAVHAVLESPYTWLHAQILLEQAACLTRKANIGAARSRIAQALTRSEASGYMESHLRCITFASGNAVLTGDLQGDWREILEGLRIFWSGNYTELRGYSLYDPLISAAEFASEPHLQVAAWKQAITLIDSDADLLQRGLAHFYLAQAAMDAHLLSVFDDEYREYNRLMDAAPEGMAKKSNELEVQLVTAKLEAKRGDPAKARNRLVTHLGAVQDSGTYRAADFYATLGELDLQVGAVDADQYLRLGLAVTEQILGTLHTDKERSEWQKKASPVYRALVEYRLHNGDPIGALEIWEWYLGATSPETESSGALFTHLFDRTPNETVTAGFNLVSNQLPRLTRQTVLSYALLHDGLAIWVFDERGIFNAFVQRDPKEIELLARRFVEVCADPDSDITVVRRYGQGLYQLLIAPIELRLKSDRGLIVEADGALTLVPFEALVDPAAHYIGERYTVVSSLGLYYALTLRSMRGISRSDSALVAVVPAPKGFTPLPGLKEEADAVAKHFLAPRVLINDQASLEAVLNALSDASVFYFAGHALATPERTGLLMADIDAKTGGPRVLTASMLVPEQLRHLQVAVLAACDTAQGEAETYTDVESLARALIRAGVPSVVASRWKISSGASERLALPFVFPQKPSNTSAHPYYWASLNQFGGLDIQP